MSLEERQKFMDQIHNQVSGDGRLDSDVFYRQGSEEFIKEMD